MTLTVAGPAFPVAILALVPIRLTWMKRVWGREVLRYVDGWACREGTPEGDEDARGLEQAGYVEDGRGGDRAGAERRGGDVEEGAARDEAVVGGELGSGEKRE